MGSITKGGNGSYDYSFKILLIGDSGVGKSSILLSFISDSVQDLSPTIGVDFKIKLLSVGGKRLKLTIWDTGCPLKRVVKLLHRVFTTPLRGLYISCLKYNVLMYRHRRRTLRTYFQRGRFSGQERFGTLISSYYRGAHGIIFVYDVIRRETFTNLLEIWAKEVDLYSTNKECIRILVGNKVDKDKEREVTREEGMDFAQERGCLFLECSAKTRENVQQCFRDLVLKIMEVPSLLENGSVTVKRQILKQKKMYHAPRGGGCCS